TKVIREIASDRATIVTNGSTYENSRNLAPQFLEEIVKRYQSTRVGRQELEGEILDDNPRALFKRSDIDAGRLLKAPELARIVIPVDPAVTSKEDSDLTGICVAGVGAVIPGDGAHGYVLQDATVKASPKAWASRAVTAYYTHKACRIVAEANNGGE